jgi:biopolymer transport protein ExbD
MVSTVFAMPQAMEINLPPEEEDIDIAESNLLTIRVDEERRYWWNLRRESPENLPQLLPGDPLKPDTVVYQLDGDTLRGLLLEQNRANSKLNTLVLIHRDATYADMVNILDEIDVIERSWNAFKAEELGKKMEDLTRDEKFSYRYAIGDWMDRDDRIMQAALEKVQAEGGM